MTLNTQYPTSSSIRQTAWPQHSSCSPVKPPSQKSMMLIGRVWEDANGNGKRDEGEKFLNGVKIELVASGTEVVDDKRTSDIDNAPGWFEFLEASGDADELRLDGKMWKQTYPLGNANHKLESNSVCYDFGVTRV